MATVASLVSILNDKLLPYRNSYDTTDETGDNRKIRALDSGKSRLWKAVTGTSQKTRGQFFNKKATLSFGIGDRDVATPSDFHSLIAAECASVQMRPSAFDKQVWRDERIKSGNVDPATLEAMYYVVAGDTSGNSTLYLSRGTTAGISVDIYYTYKLPTWSATSDNIDDIPVPFWEMICNYACGVMIGAANDREMASYWGAIAESDIDLVKAAVEGRQFGGVVTPEDYDSDG